jgi:hypothetical protein
MARLKLLPNTITKTCPTCKLNFNIHYYLRNQRTYCSHKCASNNTDVIKKNITNSKKTFLTKYGGHPMSIRKLHTPLINIKTTTDTRSIIELENDIFDFLNSLVPPLLITRHDRTVLNGKELDFYFPEKKIALEFNGLYWHSEIGGKKNKRYHLNKTNGCLFHGIQLIHILENEWRDHKEIVQSDLRRMLKIPNSNTIDVSECNVKEIDNREKNEFLVNNHLYGEDKSGVKLGLYHNNRLVSVMTFIRSRFNKKVEWEILRYCDLLNIVIRGNSAKVLFDYFVSQYKPSSVLGYSNKRFLDDNFHLTLGFKFDKIMPPDYHYISPDYKCIYNKMFFKGDKNLKEKLLTFNPELSEWDNMKLNGYDKFWDNGKVVWIWRK